MMGRMALYAVSSCQAMASALDVYIEFPLDLREETLLYYFTKATERAREAVEERQKTDKNKYRYTVYTLKDNEDEVRYVGRTCDYDRRMKEHRKSPKGKIYQYQLNPGVYWTGFSEEEARGFEQTLMVYYHTKNLLKDSNNPMVNFVNGVGPRNGKADTYRNESKDFVKSYPSFFENVVDNELLNILEKKGKWWK